MSEVDQAYADPEDLDAAGFPADPHPDAGGAPRNWPLNPVRNGVRLPTEAEWEIACRGGVGTAFAFGHDISLLDRYAWFEDNSERYAHATRTQRPNLRGLFDGHGNVFEWCHDWYGDYPAGSATSGSNRVFRGGSWFNSAEFCRSAFRNGDWPEFRDYYVGFRVARSSVR